MSALGEGDSSGQGCHHGWEHLTGEGKNGQELQPALLPSSPPPGARWSTGVIMYTLLAGSPPFWHRKQMLMLRMIMNGNYQFGSPEWDDYSDTVKDLVRCQACWLPSSGKGKSPPWGRGEYSMPQDGGICQERPHIF